MGTRCLTIIMEDQGAEICVLYRQYDGYPTGHGTELKSFLEGIQLVNGLGLADVEKVANGMDCLAAQIIAHFKTGPGGIYLHPAGTRDRGEEYIYTVYFNSGKLMVRVEAGAVTFFGLPGTKQVSMSTLFDGEIESFDPHTIENLWLSGGRNHVVNDFIDDIILSTDTLDIPEDPFPY